MVEHGARAAVARGGVAIGALEKVQRAVDLGGDLARRERAHPGGGQLDRQRQPLQPAADVRHRRAGLRVQLKLGGAALRPLHE